MRLSAVIGQPVVSESGERLGRVHDVRAELSSSSLRITGLVVGAWGLLERLGIDAPTATSRTRTHDVVPWSRVVRIDRRGVVVREGTRPR